MLIYLLRKKSEDESFFDETENLIKVKDKIIVYEYELKELSIYKINSKSPLNHNKYNFSSNEFQLRNLNEKFTFNDYKLFSEEFCKEACSPPSVKCLFDGLINSKTCSDCYCTNQFVGSLCNSDITFRNKNECGDYKVEAFNYIQVKKITFKEDCLNRLYSYRYTTLFITFEFDKEIDNRALNEYGIEISNYKGPNLDKRFYPNGKFKQFVHTGSSEGVVLYFKKVEEFKRIPLTIYYFAF